MIREGLSYIAERRNVAREAFMRTFSSMLLEGLASKGYIERHGDIYRLSDAGRRLLADKES